MNKRTSPVWKKKEYILMGGEASSAPSQSTRVNIGQRSREGFRAERERVKILVC